MTKSKPPNQNGVFVIRKNVPLPPLGLRKGITDMMSRLELGDCVDLPLNTSRITLYSSSARLNIKVTVRKQRRDSGDFLRMWRIK